MGNSISSLLDISGRALAVQGQVVRVIGNNIANVNTPGYSRREVDISTIDPTQVGELTFGNGVQILGVKRLSDDAVNGQLLRTTTERARTGMLDEYMSLAEIPFSVDQDLNNIGSQLSKFFSSLDDLSTNPSDVPLRTRVVDAGTDLVNSIRTTYTSLSELQRQANDRMVTTVTQINGLTSQIAEVNRQIIEGENGAQQNLGLRDKRDQLLRELSEKVSTSTVQQSDGSINVTLSSGFGLVVGTTSRALEMTTNPSFAPPGDYPRGLDGNQLGFVVYDFDPTNTNSHIDLTQELAAGGGEMAGLLQFRGTQGITDTSSFDAVGKVVDIATRIELIARDLVGRFNRTYVGPDENTALAGWQSSSTNIPDVAGNTSSTPVFGLFSFQTGATGPSDTTGTTGLADDTDIVASLAAMNVGDVAGRLRFNVTDPRAFAAGRDLTIGTVTPGSITAVTGDATNITGTVANTALGSTAYAGLADLRSQVVSYTLGGVSFTGTIEQLYNQTVSYVGSEANRAKRDLDVSIARESQVKEFQSSVSGVSLDEEFASLIQFQKAFEASARMIRVGSELFDSILNIIN